MNTNQQRVYNYLNEKMCKQNYADSFRRVCNELNENIAVKFNPKDNKNLCESLWIMNMYNDCNNEIINTMRHCIHLYRKKHNRSIEDYESEN